MLQLPIVIGTNISNITQNVVTITKSTSGKKV